MKAGPRRSKNSSARGQGGVMTWPGHKHNDQPWQAAIMSHSMQCKLRSTSCNGPRPCSRSVTALLTYLSWREHRVGGHAIEGGEGHRVDTGGSRQGGDGV